MRYLRPYTLLPALMFLGFLVLYPLFMVVFASFKGGPPGVDSPFSIEGYQRAWADPGVIRAIFTTLWMAILRVGFGIILTIFVAWIINRTNTPWRGGLEVLVWLRFFLPTLPVVIAWTLILGPQGLANKFLMNAFNLSSPPLDIRSYWGIIFISTTIQVSMLYFFIAPAFRRMDASLEESSRMCGASSFTTLRRITAPLLTPALLGAGLLSFLIVLESYETELVLGTSQNIYVFSTYIWMTMSLVPVDYPKAMALSSVFLFLAAAVIILQFRILRGRIFVTVTGRGFTARPHDLGRWKWVTFSFVMLYFLVATLLPLIIIVAGSFMKIWGMWRLDAFTTENWTTVLGDSSFMLSVKNTLLLGAMAATGGLLLYTLMSYGFLRTRLPARQGLEILSWVPRMAPALVMSLGFVWAYLGGGIPLLKVLYGSLFLMALVIIVNSMPFGTRIMNGAMVQIGPELEESSRVSGASWLSTMRRIVVPLLSPAVVSAWLLLFLTATRALIIVMFLYVSSSKVLALSTYEYWFSGEAEKAAVVGIVLVAISLPVALLARYLGRRQTMAMNY